MEKKKAFTLAEILITLSIIGVVAALTIPTLIQRTGNEELVSRLNKAYSTLSQATEAIMTEQGSPKVWAVSHDNLYNAYREHLRLSKDCGTSEGCFPHGGSLKYLNGDNYNWSVDKRTDQRRMILSDGTMAVFAFSSADCTGGSATGWHALKDLCGIIYVDINGTKKPNQAGRDVFVFGLKKDGLYPAGVDDDSEYSSSCNIKSSGNGKYGWGCTARVIAEGDMNY